jgi:hypothetical protein
LVLGAIIADARLPPFYAQQPIAAKQVLTSVPQFRCFTAGVPAAFRTSLREGDDADEAEERSPSHAVVVAVTNDISHPEEMPEETNAVLRLVPDGRVFHLNDNNHRLFEGREGRHTVGYERRGEWVEFALPGQWIATPSGAPREGNEKLAIASPKTTDVLQVRPRTVPEGLDLNPLSRGSAVRAAYYSAAFLLVNAVADELMIDESELEISSLFLDRLPGQGSAGEPIGVLYLNDRLPNGAGFLRWLHDHFDYVLASVLGPAPANGFARSLLAPAHADCDSRCPGCLQHFRNMNYHGLLDWRLGLSLLRSLADPAHACGLDGCFDTPDLRGWVERTGPTTTASAPPSASRRAPTARYRASRRTAAPTSSATRCGRSSATARATCWRRPGPRRARPGFRSAPWMRSTSRSAPPGRASTFCPGVEAMTEGVLSPAGPLKPLAHISPSRFVWLRRCRLREVWAAGGESPRLPSGPHRLLGNIVHALYRQAEDRRFSGDDPAEVDAAWDREVARSEAALRQSWLERGFVPLSRSLPGLEETRLAAVRRALALARRAQQRRPSAGGVRFDRTLSGLGGEVKGELDSIYSTGDGVVLGDHKTGSVYEQADGGPLKSAYQVQLKLYAGLFAGRQGYWPARLELSDAHGNAFEVPFTQGECQALLDEARRMRELVNREVEKVIRGELPLAGLASPMPENCRYCPYRPICPPCRGQLRTWRELGAEGPIDLQGTAVGVRKGRWGLQILALEEAGSRCSIRDLDGRPERNPALALIRPGDSASAFNLRRGPSPGVFQATDYTVIYREHGGASLPSSPAP